MIGIVRNKCSLNQVLPIGVLLAIYCLAIIMAQLIPYVLYNVHHQKFFLDAVKILTVEPSLQIFGSSFSSTAYLLEPINILLNHLGVSLETYSRQYGIDEVFVGVVYSSLFHGSLISLLVFAKIRPTIIMLLILVFVTLVMAPFYVVPNKEIIVFMIFTLVTIIISRGKLFSGVMLFVIFCTLYAIYVRTYFIGLIPLVLATNIILRHHSLKILSLVLLCSLAIMLFIYRSEMLFELLNRARAKEISDITTSYIHYPFSDSDYLKFMLNRLYSVSIMLVPIPLLGLGLLYFPLFIYQLFITIVMVRMYMITNSAKDYWLLSIIIGFTILQAIFEPDYGSVFRHKIMILPFMVLLISRYYGLKRINKIPIQEMNIVHNAYK